MARDEAEYTADITIIKRWFVGRDINMLAENSEGHFISWAGVLTCVASIHTKKKGRRYLLIVKSMYTQQNIAIPVSRVLSLEVIHGHTENQEVKRLVVRKS